VAGAPRPRVPKHPLDLHERALRLLASRQRSRRELATRLRQAGFDREAVEDELARLEAVGLVDDERFAREFAEHQLRVRMAGTRGVASSLASKGVDRATVERTLQDVAGGDVDRAEALARARAARLASLPPERAFTRLVSYLVRRGHMPDVARRAARRALAIDAPGADG
jgi:regulatory protein